MKVAIYARVSSDAQDVSLSIGAQLRSLREYAARQGYQVVREFVDEAESGRTSARPAFREMIALAKTKRPPFQAILVWKLNRFSRNRLDSITYKELLRQRGINLVSINEPLEDNPSGRLLEGIIESMDEFYSANLGQDIRRGLRESAQRGFFVSGHPPYGMHKVAVKDGSKTRYKLAPDDEDSLSVRIVRRIFDMALKGLGTKEIAKALNRDGFRTSTGARWTKTYVHKILNNEAYCGTLVLGGRPGHKAIQRGESPVRVENAWPAIIDKETFRLVQEKMSARKPEAVHPRVLPSFYLLSGILYCSCGRAMTGRSAKSHRFYYYTCNRSYKQGSDACNAKSLPKDRLEKLVIEQIMSRILIDDVLTELVKLVNEELDSSHNLYREKLEVMDAELKEVNSRLTRHYDILETGKLSLDDLAPRIKELKARQEEISKARVLLDAEMTLHGARHVDTELVKTYAADLRSLLTEGDITQSKAFLRSFIRKIVIDNDKATIYYKLPVPAQWPESEEVGVLPIVPPSGDRGIRTPDLRDANAALSQLSYIPMLA
jgi:site-specific DNA recombinase